MNDPNPPVSTEELERWKNNNYLEPSTSEIRKRLIAEVERLRARINKCPDGKWVDEWGSCRVCGGEIPYGHLGACDLYKMEQLNDQLEKDNTRLQSLLRQSQEENGRLREDKRRLLNVATLAHDAMRCCEIEIAEQARLKIKPIIDSIIERTASEQ